MLGWDNKQKKEDGKMKNIKTMNVEQGYVK